MEETSIQIPVSTTHSVHIARSEFAFSMTFTISTRDFVGNTGTNFGSWTFNSNDVAEFKPALWAKSLDHIKRGVDFSGSESDAATLSCFWLDEKH